MIYKIDTCSAPLPTLTKKICLYLLSRSCLSIFRILQISLKLQGALNWGGVGRREGRILLHCSFHEADRIFTFSMTHLLVIIESDLDAKG